MTVTGIVISLREGLELLRGTIRTKFVSNCKLHVCMYGA
jgi:hypothetical protein